MTSEAMLDLFARYVLKAGEQIEWTRLWPERVGAMVETNLRGFDVGPRPDWLLIGQAEWVDSLVVAERTDLELEGQPETHAILVETGGGALYLNDPATVADLGRRLHTGLDPAAYAQVLVEYHPWSRASRALIRSRTQLREWFGNPDLPECEPPSLRSTGEGLELSFCSSAAYAVEQYGPSALDVYAWQVEAPPDAPARWQRRPVVEGVRLDGARR